MTKDILLKEIINLRDRLTDIKFQLVDEYNSDVSRHLNYTIQEVEGTIKEKILELKSIEG